MSALELKRFFKSKHAFAYLMLTPAALFLIAVIGWPLAESIRLSFTNSGLTGEQYVGLANYEKLAQSGKFRSTVLITFYWMFLSVCLKLAIGLLGAVLLNAAIPGRSLFRILVLPPWVIPVAIGCFAWIWLYNGQFGIISGVLQRIGLIDQPFEFLAYKDSAFLSTVVTDVWVGTPMITIFLLAALQNVPIDLYEAAYMDGASKFYSFRRITIPQILPVLVTLGLLSMIWTFNSFEVIWILTEGGPRNATNTLIIDTYRTAIANFEFGQGAARAVVIVAILATFSIIYLLVLRQVNKRWR